MGVGDVAKAGESEEEEVDVLLGEEKREELDVGSDDGLERVDLLLDDERGEDALAGLYGDGNDLGVGVVQPGEEKGVELRGVEEVRDVAREGEEEQDGAQTVAPVVARGTLHDRVRTKWNTERIVLMISGHEPRGNSKEAMEEMMPQIARFTLSFCSCISISIEQDFTTVRAHFERLLRDCDSASKLL